MELVNGNDGMQWKLTQPYSPALWPDMSTLDLSEFEFDG
jgi:hypothetical protein